MFVLYALPAGLLAGFLAGGRLAGLTTMRFRLVPLAIAGLLVQVVLFLPLVTERVGDAGIPIYLASNAMVLVAVLANVRLPGLPVVALGAASNLAVILANGGHMPASAEAYAAQGRTGDAAYSNTRVLEEPQLTWLSDQIALPSWLPLTNVISVGDVLIMLGVAIAIAVAMRRPLSSSPGTEDAALPATTDSPVA